MTHLPQGSPIVRDAGAPLKCAPLYDEGFKRTTIRGNSRRQNRDKGRRRMPTLDWIGKKAVLNYHRQVP